MHIFESKHLEKLSQIFIWVYFLTKQPRESKTFVQNTWELIHGGYHYNLNRLFFPTQDIFICHSRKKRIRIKVNDTFSDLRAPLLWKLLSKHTRRHTKKSPEIWFRVRHSACWGTGVHSLDAVLVICHSQLSPGLVYDLCYQDGVSPQHPWTLLQSWRGASRHTQWQRKRWSQEVLTADWSR